MATGAVYHCQGLALGRSQKYPPTPAATNRPTTTQTQARRGRFGWGSAVGEANSGADAFTAGAARAAAGGGTVMGGGKAGADMAGQACCTDSVLQWGLKCQWLLPACWDHDLG
ncbi:hypothetical protein GCM10028824_34330 [Hymenobacter segetis]